MKKYFLVSILALSLLGTACQKTDVSTETQLTQTEETPSSEGRPDIFDFVPENAEDVKLTSLNLDGTGQPEQLLTYKADTVHTLLVLRLGNDLWTAIKEDQRSETPGLSSGGKFCQTEVVNFGDIHDFVLVSKCSLEGKREGYYVFGEIPGSPGTFGDLQIQKAYLSDSDIELTNVTVLEKQLIEEYTVVESAQMDRHCKHLTVSQYYYPSLGAEGFMLTTDSNGEAYNYTECTVWPPTLLEGVDLETLKVGDRIGDWTVSSNSYAEDERHEGGVGFSGEVQITGSFSDSQFSDWPELGLICMDTLTDESTLRVPTPWFCFTNPEEAMAAIEGKEGEEVTFTIKDFYLDLRGIETNHMTTFVSMVDL